MRHLITPFLLTLLVGSCVQNKELKENTERAKNFNAGWRFKKDSTLTGAEKPDFDDSGWRNVDLPHDWSIEDLGIQDSTHTGAFDKNTPEGNRVAYMRG